MQNLQRDAERIIELYGNILKKYITPKVLLDPNGELLDCVQDLIEEKKVRDFLSSVMNGIDEEELLEKYDEYTSKERLIQIIEMQRKSHNNTVNCICGLITQEAFLSNRDLTPIELNHINFLIGLTWTDFYNLIKLFELKEELENEQRFILRSRWEELELGTVIKFRLDYYGYTDTSSWGYISGNIEFNTNFDDLMNNYIFKYKSKETWKKLHTGSDNR